MFAQDRLEQNVTQHLKYSLYYIYIEICFVVAFIRVLFSEIWLFRGWITSLAIIVKLILVVFGLRLYEWSKMEMTMKGIL